MENSTIGQRIKYFIKCKDLTVQRFEELCGFSNGYVRSIKSMPGANKIEAIIRLFPDLNREWLLTGEGEMLKDTSGSSVNKASDKAPTVAELMAIIKSQQETILELTRRLPKPYP